MEDAITLLAPVGTNFAIYAGSHTRIRDAQKGVRSLVILLSMNLRVKEALEISGQEE